MANSIDQTFSVNVKLVVNGAIDAVKAVRKGEQIRKESEFQKAVADGLSYEEQLQIRQKQLDDESNSSFVDADYVLSLEKSISDTKKLNRFNKYRTTYSNTLADLSSGKINEQTYLNILKNNLNGVDDPELRLEIQNDITEAESKVKTYKDTILSNQVKKAQYDGTSSVLNDAITRVNAARSEALIANREDEVTAYDNTLSALKSQLFTALTQDDINDFTVKSSTSGTGALDKLNFINSKLQQSDTSTPIKIGNNTYTSAKQFWELERTNYLSGNSQTFGDFFGDLKTDVNNKINSSAVRFGYPTQPVLDEALQTFIDVREKPEVAPFTSKVDATQSGVMGEALDKYAAQLITLSQGTSDFSFKQADSEIQRIGTKYGVDLSARRVQLQNLSLSDANIPGSAVPELNLKLPTENTPTPKAETTSQPGTTPPANTNVTGVREVKSGDTLSKIAADAGVQLNDILNLNPELKANPNLIQPGQKIKLPGAIDTTNKPVVPPDNNVQDVKVNNQPTPTPTPTPSPTPAPVPTNAQATKPASSYTGPSLVDYLNSVGKDSSLGSRAKLAVEKGIVKTEKEYVDAANVGANASYNERLLKALRT